MRATGKRRWGIFTQAFVREEIAGERAASLARVVFRFRLLAAVMAVPAASAIQDRSQRMVFVALALGVWIPWAAALRAIAGRWGWKSVGAGLAGDLLVVFAFQALVPEVRNPALFGYVLVVAYYTSLGGRAVGLAVSGTATALTTIARFVAPPDQRLDMLAFALFVAALIAITLLIDWVTAEQRIAIERLRTLDQIKTALLQGVSHELRTPLSVILGLAETLDQRETSPDQRREVTARLVANARRLDRLLADLLDLDRLSRGIIEPRRQAVAAGDLVRGAVGEIDLHDHPLTVQADDIVAEVDVPRAQRILENLVVNAVRHTPAGTPIWVKARADGDALLLVVEDAGPGVPDDLKQEVFEPFRRAAAGPRGSGIGLSLVARLAELHGGRAWVEDRPGGGASFRVLLGRARVGPAAPARDGKPKGSGRVGVFVVDDEADARALVRTLVEAADGGFWVKGEAGSGLEAVRLAAEVDPDVIVLDWMMPDLNGIETAILIRKARPGQRIVLFSAYLDEEIRRKARDAGIACCLPKTDATRIPGVLRALAAS